jgi:hypothetical protein
MAVLVCEGRQDAGSRARCIRGVKGEAGGCVIARHATQCRPVRALHAALRAYGPNTLLWVAEAGLTATPGVVEQIAPGLFTALATGWHLTGTRMNTRSICRFYFA